ncbi:MAG: pyridoxamine 5'-phosphate oxidase family protein [Clostridia bacterium]|nr:pyridoxamine 5'-phosphate oxidase family protein [Clostridia bacterium]
MTQKDIFDFVDAQKTAFIGSVDDDGFPNIKAMLAPRERDGVTFYYTTNTSSMRVSQYLQNPKASVYFYHRGRFRYTGVMFKGTMSVLTDAETKERIWRTGDTMFYKKGVTDPDYCVLRFVAESGRYYQDLKTESFEL